MYQAEVTLKKYYTAKVVAELTYSHRPFMGIVPVRPRAAGESPYTRTVI